MFTETMSPQELYSEVYSDLRDLPQSQILGLLAQYNNERKKKRIDAKDAYPKVYEVKSSRHNNWLFFISKAPSEIKYKGDPNVLPLTYYQTREGIRVLKPMAAGNGYGGLGVYETPVFTQYRASLNFDVNSPLDAVKHFFTHNGYATIEFQTLGETVYTTSVAQGGVLYGELQQDGAWVVHQTFVGAHELDAGELDVQDELKEDLQADIEQLLNEEDFDRTKFNLYADVASHLGPHNRTGLRP